MLVCAASFTVRAYSSDRMPFSIVSRAPSPSAEERSIVKIRHEGFIHLTRRTLIYGAMKQRSSITAKLPLALHVFSLIEQQSTLCLDSLLRVFILSLPRLFLSLSLSLLPLPLSLSLSFLSCLCSLFFRDIVSSALFCFSSPLIDCYLLIFLKRAFNIYFVSRTNCRVTLQTGTTFHVVRRVLSKHHDPHYHLAHTHALHFIPYMAFTFWLYSRAPEFALWPATLVSSPHTRTDSRLTTREHSVRGSPQKRNNKTYTNILTNESAGTDPIVIERRLRHGSRT